MRPTDNFRIDPELQPDPDRLAFDLDRALSSLVLVHSKIPEQGFTAPTLGADRTGHGVLIREDGLILTIGYLIVEAETVWLLDNHGDAIPAHVVGYDQETGFGLVQALNPLNIPVMEIGSSDAFEPGDMVILAGHGGREAAISAHVVTKQEFAGYWEYVLDEAIFTAPPHPFWGGAALIDPAGKLVGIASLFVQHNPKDETPFDGNMIVPIDILKPVFEDIVMYGRSSQSPRPWLGMITAQAAGKIVVAGLVDGGPAEQADLRVGDLIADINGVPVVELAAMFRRIWALGDAGIDVPMTVYRDGDAVNIQVRSADRADFLISPRLH